MWQYIGRGIFYFITLGTQSWKKVWSRNILALKIFAHTVCNLWIHVLAVLLIVDNILWINLVQIEDHKDLRLCDIVNAAVEQISKRLRCVFWWRSNKWCVTLWKLPNQSQSHKHLSTVDGVGVWVFGLRGEVAAFTVASANRFAAEAEVESLAAYRLDVVGLCAVKQLTFISLLAQLSLHLVSLSVK